MRVGMFAGDLPNEHFKLLIYLVLCRTPFRHRFHRENAISVVGLWPNCGADRAQEIVDGHVRRLEVLRRAGIAQRLAAGLWAVPSDLVERGKAYDFKRLGGIELELHSRSPLDRQLVAGGGSVPTQGFGGVTREALTARIDFLAEQGLVQREDRRVVGKTNLLSTLRNREINSVAQRIQQQTRLTYRPAAEGARVSGTYRQSVMLASGRFAMLDDGLGFSLVPWKPVIEPSLGRTISAVISNGEASWYLGRQRGFSR